MFEHFSIPPLQFFEATIAPTFADLVPGNMPYDSALHEFTLMDDVVNKRPIIDIRRVKNILQRRETLLQRQVIDFQLVIKSRKNAIFYKSLY